VGVVRALPGRGVAVARWDEAMVTPSGLLEAHMTTPPDFGGREIEEGLLEDLGGPRPEYAVDQQDEAGSEGDGNEAHAAGMVCGRCGAVITIGQGARRRAGGEWVHDVCPVL
jgi:hypothetical protein